MFMEKNLQTIDEKEVYRNMAFTPTQPTYSGDGVAIWEATVGEGKNKGSTFLKVQVLGGKTINCFKVEAKKDNGNPSD